MSQIIIGIVALSTTPTESSYFKVHGGLFILSLLAILTVFIGRAQVVTMFRHSWSTLSGHKEAGLTEITDSFRVLSLVIAFVSLTFVVDLSFFKHGFRIGGVAAVSIFLFFKALIERWQAARRL
jgi:hypothetical protein